VPPLARITPVRILISVLLPAPLGPMKPKVSPSPTASETPFSASNGGEAQRRG
jgi:hypothetical protein